MNAPALISFDPAKDPQAFRAALGSFATGVTIVTTDSADGPVAIVANSFASVSLDPPLVLWSPAKSSRRHAYFAGSRRFAINVLAAEQREAARAVVEAKTAITDIPHTLSHCGMPLITGALATFECTLFANHDAGDHTVILGQVTRSQYRPGKPLVFHAGQYGDLTTP